MLNVMRVLLLALALVIMSSLPATAAGTYTIEHGWIDRAETSYEVVIRYTGDASDGSVPAVTLPAEVMSKITGIYLYSVTAYPTTGGTAPDAADVAVNDGSFDVLGGKGVNLIPASGQNDAFPYSVFMGSWRYWIVKNVLNVAVANQATPSANFTVVLKLVR